MFALSGNRRIDMPARGANSSAGEEFILPRPLRRVVRFVAGLCTGRITLPENLGRLSFAGYCAAVVSYGIVAGGHGPSFLQGATSVAGFAIENVQVSGNAQTSEIDILQLLGLDGTTSLISLDIDSARRQLSELPWVESAEVRKVYPATVEVLLRERQAFGIWQHGNELSLIERSGSVIAPLRDNKFATLPLFVGRDAETAAANVEADFAAWPDLAARVKAFVRIAGRRWDAHLDNGVVVKLPESEIAEALTRLERYDAEQQVLSRDIAAVDLRLSDRITIQLTPDAVQRRQAALNERDKLIKKAGPQI